MSPLGLLAVMFAVVSIGGSAVVHVYDLLEARSRRRSGGGEAGGLVRPNRVSRLRRRGRPFPRGVLVTVRAGVVPAAPASTVVTVRRRPQGR